MAHDDIRQRAVKFILAHRIDEDMAENMAENLDEIVIDQAGRLASAQANSMPDDSADEDLHDAAEAMASVINNGGVEEQVIWLIEQGWTEDQLSEDLSLNNAPETSP